MTFFILSLIRSCHIVLFTTSVVARNSIIATKAKKKKQRISGTFDIHRRSVKIEQNPNAINKSSFDNAIDVSPNGCVIIVGLFAGMSDRPFSGDPWPGGVIYNNILQTQNDSSAMKDVCINMRAIHPERRQQDTKNAFEVGLHAINDTKFCSF